MTMLCVGTLVAKPKFKSIDNDGNATSIVIVDNNAGDSMSVSSAVFHNLGKSFMANAMRSNLENGVAKITMEFKRCTEFSNCYVVLIINGEKVRVNVPVGGVVKSGKVQ